ncbi:histidine kinase [Kineococcus sp. GCM10028916]|uniref:histidine kinase n=1 Tax=Kineococcus sp. GCM10028916 TaxID=3273394 RepID=UPI003642AC3A
MELDPYVDSVRENLLASAGIGGEELRVPAERLAAALDAAVRLALLEALSDAVGEVSRDLVPGGVELRLRGRSPEFVVTSPVATPTTAPVAAPVTEETGDEGATSRTTLRLPENLKVRVESAAAAAQLSVNAWLVRAISSAVDAPVGGDRRPPASSGGSFHGWVG